MVVAFGFGSGSLICSIIAYAEIHLRVLNMAKQPKSPASNTNYFLEKVLEQLKFTNKKLDSLIDLNQKILKKQMMQHTVSAKNAPVQETGMRILPNSLSLLSLPTSLRKTVMVLYRLESATAEDLAKETGRLRAVESSAANQLVRMGIFGKKREGRDVYFFIDTCLEQKK